MGCKGVTKIVGGGRFIDPGSFKGGLKNFLKSANMERFVLSGLQGVDENVFIGSFALHDFTEGFPKGLGKNCDAIFGSLAETHVDGKLVEPNITHLQIGNLGNPKSAGIHQGQNQAVSNIGGDPQQGKNFSPGQNLGKMMGLFHPRKKAQVELTPQDLEKKKSKGKGMNTYCRGGITQICFLEKIFPRIAPLNFTKPFALGRKPPIDEMNCGQITSESFVGIALQGKGVAKGAIGALVSPKSQGIQRISFIGAIFPDGFNLPERKPGILAEKGIQLGVVQSSPGTQVKLSNQLCKKRVVSLPHFIYHTQLFHYTNI
jgi:hypothetical protein